MHFGWSVILKILMYTINFALWDLDINTSHALSNSKPLLAVTSGLLTWKIRQNSQNSKITDKQEFLIFIWLVCSPTIPRWISKYYIFTATPVFLIKNKIFVIPLINCRVQEIIQLIGNLIYILISVTDPLEPTFVLILTQTAQKYLAKYFFTVINNKEIAIMYHVVINQGGLFS